MLTPVLSLIVPVYLNEASVSALLARLERLHDRLPGGLEAVIVVDGSTDKSLERLAEALPRMAFPSQLLLLSRNFGSFAAIQAGLQNARGQHFAVIFWAAYRRLVQREIPPGGIDIFGCNQVFRDHLLALHESNTSLVGLVYWLGFRRREVPYARLPREHGRSAWSLRRRVHYMLDSAFAFSYLPIRLMELLGLLGLLLGTVLAAVVLYARIRGGVVVPGYTATVLVVLFFGALNTLGIGLLGEYVWRAFENTKGRPRYVVARRLHFGERAQGAP